MSADRPFQALTCLFERSGQVAEIDLPAGHGLVVITGSDAATPAPPLNAGTYEISADALAGSSPFPIAVTVVPVEHIPAWAALTQKQADRVLARCVREVSAVRTTGARIQ